MENREILKFLSTPHIEGSRLQEGDSDSSQVTLSWLKSRFPDALWFIGEKLDGANSAHSLDPETLDLRQQSRGHFLSGGAKEFQFDLMKRWGNVHSWWLTDLLEDRYQMFSEWTYATHTHFYDDLPHYLHEFDIWDFKERIFLDTETRRKMLSEVPVVSAPVIYEGPAPKSMKEIRNLIVPSAYRTENWRDALREAAERVGDDPEEAVARAGDDDRMEGVYGRLELGGKVVFRWKFVNESFVQTMLDRGDRWREDKMIRNALMDGVDIFASPSWARMEI